jgi:hypothetical protein
MLEWDSVSILLIHRGKSKEAPSGSHYLSGKDTNPQVSDFCPRESQVLKAMEEERKVVVTTQHCNPAVRSGQSEPNTLARGVFRQISRALASTNSKSMALYQPWLASLW